MIDRDLPVTEDELHAYADGELPDDRRSAVRIGVQLVFRDGEVAVDHLAPHFTRRSAGRSPSR